MLIISRESVCICVRTRMFRTCRQRHIVPAKQPIVRTVCFSERSRRRAVAVVVVICTLCKLRITGSHVSNVCVTRSVTVDELVSSFFSFNQSSPGYRLKTKISTRSERRRKNAPPRRVVSCYILFSKSNTRSPNLPTRRRPYLPERNDPIYSGINRRREILAVVLANTKFAHGCAVQKDWCENRSASQGEDSAKGRVYLTRGAASQPV